MHAHSISFLAPPPRLEHGHTYKDTGTHSVCEVAASAPSACGGLMASLKWPALLKGQPATHTLTQKDGNN